MAFLPGKPNIHDWIPSIELEEDDREPSATDLKSRSGYSGKRGPYADEARVAYGGHFDHLERQMKRFLLNKKYVPMYPHEPEGRDPKKPLVEQTPFGPVIANRSKRNDPNYLSTGMVSYIESKESTYSAKKPGGALPSAKSEGWTYEEIAHHMRSTGIGPDLAHAVLEQVYETLARRDLGESDKDRQSSCLALQPEVAKKWADPFHRRIMAVLYALTILSEEQRSAGGKVLRSALRLIADSRMTPEVAFTTRGLKGPAVAQTLSKGGMERLRFRGRGGAAPDEAEAQVIQEMSASSDVEDTPEETARRRRKQAKRKQGDLEQIELDKERRRKRQAGISTHPNPDDERSDDEQEGFESDDEPSSRPVETRAQSRKRKLMNRKSGSDRAGKLRRVDSGSPAENPRAVPGTSSEPRRSARLNPAQAEKRSAGDEARPPDEDTKRRRLSARRPSGQQRLAAHPPMRAKL